MLRRKYLLLNLIVFSTVGFAQVPLRCSLDAATTALLRSTGATEATSDLIVTCTGGAPTALGQAVPPTTFTFTSNAGVTSRQIGSGLEALMLAEEPAPSIQSACASGACTVLGTGTGVGTYDGSTGHPNIFQGAQAGANAVTFSSIPLDPPGSTSSRTLRFTNLKVDATSVSAGSPVTFSMSVAQNPQLIISNALALVGTTKVPLMVTSSGVQTGANGLAQFNVSFTEGFPSVFRTRTIAVDPSTSPPPGNQNSPGQYFPGSETQFYNSSLAPPLGRAGLADSGTRLMVVFTGIPRGVQFASSLTVPIGQGSGVLRLVNTDASGAGPFVAATSTVLTPDQNGTIVAVYEVLSADSGTVERADVPFQVIYAAGAPRIDTLSVSAGLAPTGGAVVPRFGGLSTVQISTLGISPSSIPRGSVGVPYRVAFTATGGVSPFTWSATGLPSGLTMSPSGTLSGTASVGFNGTITVTVTDNTRATASAQYNLAIVSGFVITTTALPNGTLGAAYDTQIQTAGGTGTVSFAIAPSTGTGQSVVPPGLALTSTGELKGTPQVTGTYTFAVAGMDQGGNMDSETFTVNIAPALLLPTSSPLPSGVVGTLYSFAFTPQGGTPPYSFSITDTPPPGLALTASGLLTGTPTIAGTYSFTVKLIDQLQVTVSKVFSITFTAVTGQLQATPATLTFSTQAGSDPPAPQMVQITSGTTPTGFSIALDSGAQGSAVPKWLSVQTMSGTTPAAIMVSVDPSLVTGTSADARILISVTADPSKAPAIVAVHLDIAPAGAPQIDVAPAVVRFMSRAANPVPASQTLLVRNTGSGGSLAFTASVVGNSPWLSVSPLSGKTVYNDATPLTVTVSPQGLKTGSYRDVIHVVGGATSQDVPVSLFVAPPGPILSLDTRGTRFIARQGAGTTFPQLVHIWDIGDQGTMVNWQADLLSGSEWLTIGPTQGTASPGNPGILTITISPNAVGIPSAQDWGLVRIQDSSSLGSPQFVTVLLDIAVSGAAPEPQLSDGFLYFSSQATGTPAAQSFTAYTSSTSAVPFQVSAQTNSGGQWLAANSPVNTVSTAVPAQVNVTVNPTGLTAGIYKGQINVLIGSILRTKDVTLVIPATTGATAPEGAMLQPRAASCAPTSLSITMGSISTGFNIPAGAPAILSAQVNDNCANPISDASVTTTFSNGETPKKLQGDGVGNAYTENFAPTAPLANASITFRASRAGLQPATQVLSGSVQPSSTPVPVLSQGGTVNNLNVRKDAPPAPGEVVSIYGSNLSSQAIQGSVVPLATTLNNTSVLVNGTPVPLYFVSGGQINAELPVGLPITCCQSVIVNNNGVLSLSEQITSTSVDPGVAILADGTIIAQRADGSVVDAAHPAKPGEVLVMYLVGMGATNPSGVTGAYPPPGLAPTVTQPTVTIGTLPTTLYYAGLTPTGIGLYQINFQVPLTAPTGSLDVVIQQGTATANATKLIVAR